MAKNVVSLFNLALSTIGTRSSVSATTEASREAEVCNIWYEISRDVVLRAAFWPSTLAHKRLAVLKERTNLSADWTADDPAPDWVFAYGEPSDMIAPRFLTTFSRFTVDWWKPTTEAHKKAIMTNQPEAILQYSFRQDNPGEWDDSLYLAVAYALAMNIAMPLHSKLKVMQATREAANALIISARVNVANAEENLLDTIPEWISARGYGNAAPQGKFFWPYGPILASSTQTVTSNA